MKKLDMSKLRNLEKKRQEDKSGKNDGRFLNYFDIPKDETMAIRLLPDGGDSGSFYIEYAVHGEAFDDPRIGTMPCANNHGERCPACAKSYALYKEGNEDEAAKWRKKTKYLAQCVVIDSSIEVTEHPEGKIVYLLNMPFQMYDRALEGIMNGTVDDPFDMENGNNFVIKKTKKGKFNQYDKSYWDAKPSEIPVSILEELVDDKNELYDLSTFVPDGGSPEDVAAWIEKTEATLAVSGTSHTPTPSKNDDGGGSDSNNDSSSSSESAQAPAPSNQQDKVRELLEKMRRA